MSKKDLFKKQNPNKFISSANYDKLKEEVESKDFIKEKIKTQKSFTPRTDFSKPESFARYGLAEEYYRTSVEYIYNSYPYDGSLYEREDWYNRGTYLDQYIFENLYPRTNGYVVLGDGWGAQDATVGDYSLSTQSEYIGFTGGPHLGFDPAGDRTISKANYFKASKNRENNLKLDLEGGVTVEFWLKKGAFDNTLTKKEVLFDLWNNNLSSSADYGRLTIELSASAVSSDHVFLATCQSGTDGYFQQEIGNLTTAAIADDNWHHYAVSFASASGGINTKFYRDGQYVEEKVLGTAFSDATAAKMSANIGALVNAPSGNIYHGEEMLGYGKVLSSSFDEFRYWKTERNAKQIFQNYNNQVGGGTNTDDANTLLGVYFKFNEGVTGTDTDATVLDYSGRVSNGSWTGYEAGDRNVGSAIVSASASSYEYKDPIIYSFHPDVSTLKSNLENSGSVHDNLNTSALFFSLPSWIIEEDESYGGENLRHLTQIMGSYLDTLYLQIEELKDIKSVEYTSGSVKPLPFGDRLLSDKGMLVPELFVDMDIVEQLYNRNEKTNYQTDLTKIKNKIYENLYNNLTHIYKSKGTYDSFRNTLNSLGISQKIVDINLYSNNAQYEILDNTKLIMDNKKKINFKDPDNNSATIHQFSSSAEPSKSFISGSGTGKYYYTPITIDSCLTLPSDKIGANFYYQTITNSYLTCSLFGFHDVDEAQAETDLTWLSPDQNQLQAHAIRPTLKTPDGYFLLTGSVGGANIELTSSTVKDLFTNTNWNVSVRFKHVNYPLTQRVSGAFDIDADAYLLEFSGYNASTNYIENEFKVTASVSEAQGLLFTEASKRLYVGAHRENFTGSVYQNGYSFAKISNINFWYNYLSDNDLKSHLRDLHNYGITNSERDAYLLDSNYSTKVKNIDTLMLRWDFETVTGSDSSGNFTVNDLGNFQGDTENQYYHSGKGFGFEASSTDVVKKEKVATYKLAPYDTVSSNEMISILSQDDDVFSLDKRPINYYFAAEKSFYKAVDDRILEYFSTLKDFNNLVGESANRYRPEYKQLKKYRQYFFNKVQNELDFERFLDYYKWVDTSIAMVIEQLIPATAEFSSTVWNVIESHVLERNKFQHKLPVIKPQTVYETTIQAAPNSYPFSTKGNKALNLQNANPLTASSFLSASVGAQSTFFLSGTVKNIASIDTNNVNRRLYISGSDQLNTIGVPRTLLKDQKGSVASDGFHSIMITEIKGNDDYFLDPFASVVTTTDSIQISGVVDYTLPTRLSQPQFIRTRFAAPGGYEVTSLGYLDFETSQYSVYNNMNYRNAIVRKALDEIYSAPDDDPTILANPEDGSYFLGVYRNPRKEYVTSAAGFVTQSFFDNGFIQYPIPASDLQYDWIEKSYSSSNLEFLLNQTGSEEITFKPETFFSWAASPGSATNIYGAEVNSSTNTSTVVLETPSASNNYFSSIGKFGYNTWLQTRNGDSLVVRTHKKNNTLSVDDSLPILQLEDSNGQRIVEKGLIANSFTNYTEPLVIKKYKPIRHVFVLNTEAEEFIEVQSSYAGKLASFSNRELNAKFNLDNVKVDTGYEKVKQLYLNNAKIDGNPIKGWTSVEYSERVWPKEKFEGVNSHRDKPNYDSTSEQLLDILGTANTIWQKEGVQEVRKRGGRLDAEVRKTPVYTDAKNSMGHKSIYSENVFPLSDYAVTPEEDRNFDGEEFYIASAKAGTSGLGGLSATFNVGDKVTFTINETAYELTASATDNDGYNSWFRHTEYGQSLQYLANTINQHPIVSQHVLAGYLVISSSSPADSHKLGLYLTTPNGGGNISVEVSSSEDGAWTDTSGPNINTVYSKEDGELNSSFYAFYTPVKYKENYFYQTKEIGHAAPLNNRGFKNEGIFGSGRAMKNAQYLTQFGADELAIAGITITASVSSSLFADGIYNHYLPTASLSYVNKVKSPVGTGSVYQLREITPYHGHTYRVPALSEREPFFASFAEYNESIKFLTDDYAIIPEFNISEHMSYYVDQKGANFRATNKKFLDLKGAINTTSSAETEISNYNADFYKDYVNTEFLQGFKVVKEDHDKIGKTGEVTLTCKGVKKFLPKQGFYPMNRSVQLGTLFSQSVGPSLTAYTNTEHGAVEANQNSAKGIFKTSTTDGELYGTSLYNQEQINANMRPAMLQAALQPLFAPGIFFNTIKSGIAVDFLLESEQGWATDTYTNNIKGNFDHFPSSSNVITGMGDPIRVPFEALTDLNKFPTNLDIPYLCPSFVTGALEEGGQSRPFVTFRWDGVRASNLYEKAMNNYLAESANFFLKEKSFTSFVSDVEENFKLFEAGKTYYMDIALQQTSNHVMFDEVWVENEGTGSNLLQTIFTDPGRKGRTFGPPFGVDRADGEWYAGGDAGLNISASYIASDPSYAPYTPPYFYGKSVARVEFTPTETRRYTLEEVQKSSSITYFNEGLDGDPIQGTATYNGAAIAYQMSLSSSVNLLGKITQPDIKVVTRDLQSVVRQKELSSTSNLSIETTNVLTDNLLNINNVFQPQADVSIELGEPLNTNKASWRISTKYECPVLNFYEQEAVVFHSRGMWSGLGELPTNEKEGIFLSVLPSFSGSYFTTNNTGSLADQLGFKPEKKRIGAIAEKTVIKEAIVAIPFLERENISQEEADLTVIEKQNFFSVDREILEQQIKDNKDTTLTRMYRRMQNYVIPPNYNFVKYRDINPFVMYLFEFDVEFDQQDLAYMWQGVMPDASLTGNEEFDEVTIKHMTGKDEFFHGKEIPSDVRWLIFKVKQKARKDYLDVVNLRETAIDDYGYNWPYDYCSIVEMAKVEATLKIVPKDTAEEAGIKLGKILEGEE